jgi:hypothetical protein
MKSEMHMPIRPFNVNSEQLDKMLRRGWAAVAYFDSDGTLHVGMMERDAIEFVRADRDENGEGFGEAMLELHKAKTDDNFAANLLRTLDESAHICEQVMGVAEEPF